MPPGFHKDAITVSVIVPSFNQGSYLEETINSVLNQSYEPIELIIIDGGSTDTSVEIIKKYESKIAYWISEPDNGQADAINKGFAIASGELLCWVNSDDILYPEFVSTRVRQFEMNNEVSMIYGDVDQGWDIHNKIIRKGKQQTFIEMVTTCMVKVPQMSAIWKREVFSILGGLDPSLNLILDWEYFVRIANRFKILYISGSVAFFRQHNNSKAVSQKSKWADEIIDYYEKHIFVLPYNPDINYKHTRQNLYFFCSVLYKESYEEVLSQKYLKMAREVSCLRFFRISVFKYSIQFLVRIKKAIMKWI